MYNEKFYQAVGHAFYAIAHADKKISKEEFKEVIKIVKEQWVPIEDETDEFGEDMAFQIVYVFDWLADKDEKEKEALKHFNDYVTEHPKLFNDKIKHKIINTCKKIAEKSYGINKSENKILHEIKNILNLN